MLPSSGSPAHKTCILIEDDKNDQAFFKSAVAQLPFPVTCNIFDNISDLLESHKQSPIVPDIFFIGHNKPYIRGMLCAEILSKLPEFAGVPIVIHSDLEKSVVIKAFEKTASTQYLSKSDSLETLLSCMAKFIDDSYQEAKSKGGIQNFT